MDNPGKPIATDSLRIGIAPVDEKRETVVELIAELGTHPTETITEEHFLTVFTRLPVVMAEFFAREEEVIELIGLPESDTRKHFMEHDKLLDFFNMIYMDSIEQQKYNGCRDRSITESRSGETLQGI